MMRLRARSARLTLLGTTLLALATGIALWLSSTRPPQSEIRGAPALARRASAPFESRRRDDTGATAPADLRVPDEASLSASRAVEVHGFVLGPDGLPAADAQLWSERGEWLADVDQNGEFVVRLGTGPKLIHARAGNAWSGPTLVRASDADNTVILRLEPASELMVQVISAEDYSAIGGARVWAVVGSHPQRQKPTHSDGTVRLALPAGSSEEVLVVAEAVGWGRASRVVPMSRASGDLRRLTLELPRAAVVRGHVMWASENPAIGAQVIVHAEGGVPRLAVAEVDEQGRFIFDHLYAGTFRFDVQIAGAAIFNRVEQIGPAGGNVDFELGGPQALRGIVREADNRAAANVVVEALVGVARGFLEPQRQTVLTNDSGQFELDGVGDTEVQVTAVRAHERSPTVVVPPGELGPIEMRLGSGGRISGTVRFASGDAVPGAEVSATQVRSSYARLLPSARVRTDSEGAFELVGLAPGEWTLRARGPEDLLSRAFEGRGVTASTGQRGVALTVSATGAIEARVQFADGRQPEEVTVMLAGHAVPSVSGPDLVLAGIPAGVYDILLTGPEFEPMLVPEVDVPAGDVAALERVVVRPGRTLRGRVSNARGEPVVGAKVLAGRSIHARANSLSERQLEREPASRVAHTGKDGTFVLPGVIAEGPMAVVAEHPQFGRSPVLYTGDDPTPSAIELRLVQTTSLEGRIMDAETPLEGVAVIAESGKMVKFNGITAADGRYRIDGLPPGEYEVTAARSTLSGGFDLMRQSVQVSQDPATLDFEFRRQTVHVTVAAREADGVLLRGPALYLEEHRTDQGFEFASVTPGNYTICVVGPKNAPQEDCRPWAIQPSPPRQSIAW